MRLSMEFGCGRCMANVGMPTDQEADWEGEVVDDGTVNGVAVSGWFDDLDVSPPTKEHGLRVDWDA